MKFALNGDVKIAYEVAGSGLPIVLIHANPFDRRMWLYQLAQYAPMFRTINVDIRGYGESDKPATAFTLDDMAEDVLAVCRQEGITSATFVGASIGAWLALLIALDEPGLANALLLVGGGASPAPVFPARVKGYLATDITEYRREHIRQLVAPSFAESPRGEWLIDLFLERTPTISGPCISQVFRALNECDFSARLKEIRVPALIVNGEFDLGMARSLELAREIPGAQHVIIPGTGHACNLEAPELFDNATRAFLAKHARA